ncbi:uncharacterized protein B0T15DRAFT_502366 [Chaetomium strumarium]|uniref:Choline/carnitine acyltransferase domain-containing protein n=1 Tax=Chaetomium strumarium TaxID=1170767 RepID=A0AAJ0M180_9PEZI|nr:hypothetical protein B0T15DRAFT_502366 [Chaetomium strumarium]
MPGPRSIASVPPAPQYGPTLEASLELLDVMGYQGKDKVVETLAFVGAELKERFEAAARTKHISKKNWVTSEYRDRFLRLRGPLVNTTLVGLMKTPPGSSYALTTAAMLLYAVAKVYRSSDIVKTFGTDGGSKKFETRQLREGFATVRIPGIKADSFQTSPGSRHALVWYNGLVFEVQILNGTYEPVPLNIIMRQLLEIQSQCSKQTSDTPTVATLSSYLPRADWAGRRASLLRTHPGEMKILETAITSIGIERQRPSNSKEAVAQRQGFSTVYSDQTLGYLVFPSGSYVYRGEHGALDGGAALRIAEAIGRVMESIPEPIRSAAFSKAAPASSKAAPRPRRINLPPVTVHVDVSKTRPSFLQASETGIIQRSEDDLRKLKHQRLYGFVLQMALQVALQHVSPNSFTSLIEATSTRDFAYGRCDPNWLITHESKRFCSTLITGATDRDSQQLFEAAYKKYMSSLRRTRQSFALAANIDLLHSAVTELKDKRAKSVLLPIFPPLWARDAYLQGYSSDQLFDPLYESEQRYEAIELRTFHDKATTKACTEGGQKDLATPNLQTVNKEELCTWLLSEVGHGEAGSQCLPQASATTSTLRLVHIRQQGRGLLISPSALDRILDGMKADPAIRYMICRDYDGFHEWRGGGYRLTRFYGLALFALVWTFDPVSMTTTALFIDRAGGSHRFEEFVDVLRGYQSHMHTPSLLCFVSCYFLLELFDRETVGERLQTVQYIEMRTGFAPDMNSFADLSWGRHHRLHWDIDQLSWLLREVNDVTINISNHVRHQESSRVLLGKLCHRSNGTCQPIEYILYLKVRAERLSTVLFALLTHEDASSSIALAAAAKHDSSSMKTIAVMTMAFLPATFFAALFAVPSLQWDQSTVVQDNFWVYWAFTAPTTVLVFLIWLLATKRPWLYGLGWELECDRFVGPGLLGFRSVVVCNLDVHSHEVTGRRALLA